MGALAVPDRCGPRWRRSRPASRSRPRGWSSRRCGSRASSTTSGTGRSPTSSTSSSWPPSPRPRDPRRAGAKTLSHEDLSQLVIERELGPLIRGLRRAPGAVPERDRFAERRGDRPALGLVPGLEAAARRRVDARAGCASLQPLLSGVFTVDNLDYVRRDAYLTGVSMGPGRRRAAAPLRVRLGARADAVRVGRRRARDVPHRPPVHVPARLPAPDGPRDRPRPRARCSRRRSWRCSATGRRPSGWGVRRPRRVRAAPPGRAAGRAASTCRRRRSPGDGTVTRAVADGWRAILLRRPRWRAEREVRPSRRPATGRPALLAELGDPRSRDAWSVDLTGIDARPGADRAPDPGDRAPRRRARAGARPRRSSRLPAWLLIGRRYRRAA